MSAWFVSAWSDVTAVVLSAIVVYVAIIVATRISGLRSFSKMSGFDFAVTVAMGTLIANTILTRDPPIAHALVGIATLFALQKLVARLRIRSSRFAAWVDNRPVLLVEDGRILDDNLRRVRVTRDELHAAVRAASVSDMGRVRAAVLEATGDISVIPGPDAIDPTLLRDIRRG